MGTLTYRIRSEESETLAAYDRVAGSVTIYENRPSNNVCGDRVSGFMEEAVKSEGIPRGFYSCAICVKKRAESGSPLHPMGRVT